MSFQFYAMLKLPPLSSLRTEDYMNSLAPSKIPLLIIFIIYICTNSKSFSTYKID